MSDKEKLIFIYIYFIDSKIICGILKKKSVDGYFSIDVLDNIIVYTINIIV